MNILTVLLQCWLPQVGGSHHLKCCNRQWDVGATLIQTFASLIVLSSVEILGVTFDILTPTKAYSINGTYRYFFYYDANIEYLRGQHLYYALLAILLSCVCVIFPFLLLILYPCKCFQKILNFLG